jgi:aryl-alcohol dehydrogenase-like predicted oxidoreductase
MEKRLFGATGDHVTILGYGAMELRHVTEAQGKRLLNAVLDAGINYIDTSPDYGPSEDMIGNYISHRRSEYFLATKCGCDIPPSGNPDVQRRHLYTGKQLLHNIEHSLKRLKTDYVDVWQIHNAYPEQLLNTDVLETMHQVKDSGQVRHIAVSMSGAAQGYGYVQFRDYLQPEWSAFDAMQVWYSALVRYSEQAITQAAAKGVGTVIRGATRRVDPYTSLADACTRLDLDDLRAADETAAQFLLRFVLTHPDIHTIIVGTKNLEHLADNVAAAHRGALSDDEYQQALARLSSAGITSSLSEC